MGKSKKSKGSVTRPAPYGKARVQVSFDGPSQPQEPVASMHVNGHEAKDKGKGKGKAKETASLPAAAGIEEGPSSSGSDTFIIIAGSYEKLLYGLEGSYAAGSSKPTLKPIFIFPAHWACVKAVAASPGGKWLATGSEDEFVKVWDLRRRKEVGSLSQHEGSITALHFPTSSHLLTASTDSTLSLFRTSDWALLKSLKGHSGRINHVDVHPTGRVALSVGKDKTLKMWDLMRGRGASSLPLGEEAELVKFSPQGTHFAVLYPKKIEIYSLTLRLLHTLETKSRFNTLLFVSLSMDEEEASGDEEEVLCVGTEKGVVEVYSVDLGDADEPEEDEDEADGEGSGSVDVDLVATLGGHTNRVKSISAMPLTIPGPSSSSQRRTILLTSVSSDGRIHLYDLDDIKRQESSSTPIDPIASYDTKGTRLTCVYMAEGRKDGGRSVVTANGNLKDEEVKVESEDEELEGEDGDTYSQDSDDVEGEDDGIEIELEEEEEEVDEQDE